MEKSIKKIEERNRIIYKRINTVHTSDLWQKIAVWNMQSLNIDINRRYQKLEFIRDVLNNNPMDFVYLIDVNDRNNCLVLNGYEKYSDERNMLFVKSNIKNKFIISRNCIFDNQSKLAFMYIVPSCNDSILINNFFSLLKMNFSIIGDINLKSNKKLLKVINYFKGEETLQTGFVTKKVAKFLSIAAPSDHRFISAYLKVNISYDYNLRLVQINEEHCYESIKNILTGNVPVIEPKVKFVRNYVSLADRETTINAMINDYLQGKSEKIYRRYNYLWRGARKEPFLGMTIPKKVESSFSNHLQSVRKKEYKDVKVFDLNNKWSNEIIIKNTKSRALNDDFLQLNTITESASKIIAEKDFDRSHILSNLFKVANLTKSNLNASTFFLLKNARLSDFNDVRVIIIIPTLIKVYEAIIYDSIIDFFTKNFKSKEFYQFGAIPGGSTYLGMGKLRSIYNKFNGDAIVFFDISKGYDCVNLSLLENLLIKYIDDKDILDLLLNWLTMIKNLDYVINGNKILRTRGIAMGLSLSPVIFIFYVDCILKQFDCEKLVMFIDDLAMVKPGNMSIKNFFEEIDNLIKVFAQYDLLINKNKTGILTNNDDIKNEAKDIEIISKEKYLGRMIRLDTDGRLIADDRWYNLKAYRSQNIPYWSTFFVKKLIYTSAIEARTRYRFLMWSCNSSKIRMAIWRNAWFFLKSNFAKFSYLEVSFCIFNVFRYCIDIADIEKWENDIKNGINEETLEKEVKNKLTVENDNINEAIYKLNIDFNFKGRNYWEKCANFCDSLFKKFKNHMIGNYMYKKVFNKDEEDRVYYPLIEQFLNSKFFQHFGFTHSIVLTHVENKKRSKQILAFLILNSMGDLHYIMENFLKDYKMSDDFSINGVFIKMSDWVTKNKDYINELLNMDNNSWTKEIMKLFKSVWYVIDNLMILADICTTKAKDDINILTLDNMENLIFIDGSYNSNINKAGYGIFVANPQVMEISNSLDDSWSYLRNVAGELYGCIEAIKYAIEKKWKIVNIAYDFIGIENYLNEKWKTKDNKIIGLIGKYRILKKHIVINFYKVPSHTEVRGNVRADNLAKKAVNLKINQDKPCKLILSEKNKCKNLYRKIFKLFTAFELLLYNNNVNDYTLDELIMALQIKDFSIADFSDKIFNVASTENLDGDLIDLDDILINECY